MGNKTILILFALTLINCKTVDKKTQKTVNDKNIFEDDFTSQVKFDAFWIDDSFTSPHSYHLILIDGNLKITTRGKSKDRVKVKSKQSNFGIGTYTWQIYIPKYTLYDKCSIGAFIYHYNSETKVAHELDFEIGSGKKQLRKELGAKQNQAIVYCSYQKYPQKREEFLIETEKWHSFKLSLSNGEKGNYVAKWYINNKKVKTLQTDVKSDITFSIHNSLENLDFIGEQTPVEENYVLFRHFIFEN